MISSKINKFSRIILLTKHHYILALSILKEGRLSLLQHFDSDDDIKDFNLLNKIIESTPETAEIIRKIFFLNEATLFLSRIKSTNTIFEIDGKERHVTQEDIINACKGIGLYLDTELPLSEDNSIRVTKKEQLELLLDANISMDKKIDRLKYKILMEKQMFEKKFKQFEKEALL